MAYAQFEPSSSLLRATANNSDTNLSMGMDMTTTNSSMTTLANNDGAGKRAVEPNMKSQERQYFLDVEMSGASRSDEDRPKLIELPYSPRKRKLKVAIIAFMVSLDGFLLPTVLFYILKYGAHLSDARSIQITTFAFGLLSFYQYVLRLYRLLKRNSTYLPLHSPHRWYFDVYQIQFTIGMIAITLLLTLGSHGDSGVRNVSLAPCILFLQCGPQFLVSALAYKKGWVNKFRFSSTLPGEKCVPAVFTIIEDVIGVDGKGGGKGGFRELIKGRYMQSWRFREMLYWQTVFWGVGAMVGAAITMAVVLAPSVNQYVAYGFGWCFPFLWSAVMIVITIKKVQRDLKREKHEWDTADISVIRGYQLWPVVPS